MVRVLVVDDEKDVRDAYSFFLSDDHEVVLARDGRDGLEKAVQLLPDYIIADRNMPIMNGYKMAQELKKDERTKNIPIAGIGDFLDSEKGIFDIVYSKTEKRFSQIVKELLDL